jgi:hypothetical protein
MTTFTDPLSWIQTGEPLSAGFEGGSSGVMNRVSRQLLLNDKHLRERIVVLEENQFVNKVDSFFFDKADKHKCFRLNGCSISLPQMFEEDDGITIKIIKFGTCTILNPFSYFQGHLLGETLTAETLVATIAIEYVFFMNTWIPIYSTGTWEVV